MTLPPRTPGRKEVYNEQIAFILEKLSSDWDMKLSLPGETTPTISTETELGRKQKRCLGVVKFLTFKEKIAPVYLQFEMAASSIYNGWVTKPKAVSGIPQRTENRPHHVTIYQREQLMDCFLEIADNTAKQIIVEDQATRSRGTRTFKTDRKIDEKDIDDTPIPINLPTPKRVGEQNELPQTIFKRPKVPHTDSTTSLEQQRGRPASNNTSFVSARNLSVAHSFVSSRQPSIFESGFGQENSQSSSTLTQITVPDDNAPDSSNYGSTPTGSFDHNVDAATFSFDGSTSFISVAKKEFSMPKVKSPDPAETALRESLCKVFPACDAPSLLEIPFYFQYEVVRVFLHTGVTMDRNLVLPRRLSYGQYDRLWAHLRKLPTIQGRPFPPKTDKAIWNLLSQDSRLGSRGIIMGGFLNFLSATDDSIFQLLLRPLQLDRSHRLERRFGCDRFLEIDVPNIEGYKVPKTLRSLGKAGKSIILDWLMGEHNFIADRSWRAFCNKPLRPKDKKLIETERDNKPAHRIFLFATNGNDFGPAQGTPTLSNHVPIFGTKAAWTVDGLLNWIRPTLENESQPALKLYARTTLALSRNSPTVVIQSEKIRHEPDIKVDGEDMTDGAGRLSYALAQNIAGSLALEHLPCGFQARFGDAKGLWSIDPLTSESREEWIEIRDSQSKWKRHDSVNVDYHDPAYRTFEVNGVSSELKSADLNTQFLPILIDRSIDKSKMISVIEKLLEQNLSEKIKSQREAMTNPLTCRKWIQETNSRITEKIKLGVVPFAGGLPAQLGDRMSLMLDAGFHPEISQLLREMTQQLYTRECEDLRKELKITVHKSTYAYMIPDFAGVLEPDEIYLHLSRNVGPPDAVESRSGFPLRYINMLVARCPAHFESDIQKVKAVFKPELAGLQDVIVFPTKGTPSLAKKLSGGDYDGDKAWICWESSIVDNFENAKVPTQPDLVAEGYMEKVSTTYKDLMTGEQDPTAVFLRKAFDFNLEPSMLGICTTFKENYTYAHPNLSSNQSIYLSTLLSNLVDQAKQGYKFTDSHWQRFKKEALGGVRVINPAYKEGVIDRASKHFMDRLKVVADRTITQLLIEFNKGLKPASSFDSDLTQMFNWAMRLAAKHPQLTPILDKLKGDIKDLNLHWSKSFAKNRVFGNVKDDELRADFGPIRDDCYERYQTILPQGDPFVIQLLLGPPDNNFSQWDLIKASMTYKEFYLLNFPWWMAGKELCFLKARSRGVLPVAAEMYAMLKPDARFVRLRMAEIEGRVEEDSVIGEEGDGCALSDNGDDEDVVMLVDD